MTMVISQNNVETCEARRKSVENIMAIMLSATNGPDELFLKVLDACIFGEIPLEQMEERINEFEYLKCDFESNTETVEKFKVLW